ncbi:MAG: hypothetical protein WC700_10285 [Gemmatimonadaceae bacterium]|jgi:hypothetical protein
MNDPQHGQPLFITFDGPPGSDGPRFIDVETTDHHSVSAGEWVEREDGYWGLGPFYTEQSLRITEPAHCAVDYDLVTGALDEVRTDLLRCRAERDAAIARAGEAERLCVKLWDSADDWHGERASSHYRSDVSSAVSVMRARVKP